MQWQYEIKTLQNAFKRIALHILIQIVSIILLLKNNLPKICRKINKTGMSLWMVYTCSMHALQNTYERWEKGECTLHRLPKSWEICGSTRPF